MNLAICIGVFVLGHVVGDWYRKQMWLKAGLDGDVLEVGKKRLKVTVLKTKRRKL